MRFTGNGYRSAAVESTSYGKVGAEREPLCPGYRLTSVRPKSHLLLTLAVAALFLASCERDERPARESRNGTSTPQAVPVPTAPDTGPPTAPRPRPPRADGPPPAWLETEDGSFWLGYSSYCWGTSCVDFIGPSCHSEYTPKIGVRRGELVSAHLGFEPSELDLSFHSRKGRPSRAGSIELTLSRTPSWRAEREGAFLLFTRAKHGGDAAYVACVEFE